MKGNTKIKKEISLKSFEDLECWKACTDDKGKSYLLFVIGY